MRIRKATIEDIESITVIYNDAVLHTTATFDTDPKSVENRRQWFVNRTENFPVIVAEDETTGMITGYASLSPWSDKKAYDITAELSLYVHPGNRHMGIGKKLLIELLEVSRGTNLNSIISRITEGNEHSIYLHHQNGFETVGILKQAGRKFDKLLDVTILQKMLRLS